jgi:hypothetical protein
MISLILGRVQAWLMAGVAVFGALLAIWFNGRRTGTANARIKNMEADIHAAGERRHAEMDADRSPDATERLQRDWQRK